MNDEVIRSAKFYARSKEKSLSKLVENYLKSLTISSEKHQNLAPEILKLKGKLKLPEDFDYKKELADAISKKQ
jgi:hypothetical protein